MCSGGAEISPLINNADRKRLERLSAVAQGILNVVVKGPCFGATSSQGKCANNRKIFHIEIL
jgi:hypothetical protein